MGKRKDIHRQFGSWGEFVDHGDRPNNAEKLDRSSRATGKFEADWTGTPNYSKAVGLATLGGWDEAKDQIRDSLDRVRSEIRKDGVGETWSRQYAVAGALPSVPLYCTGSPVPMVQHTPVADPTRGKVVRLLVNLSASSGVSPSTLIARGAAVAALSEALTVAGFTLEVVAAISVKSRDTSRTLTYTVVVKAAGDPADPERITFALAHPSSLRRLTFAAWEQEAPAVRREFGFKGGGGYGIPVAIPADVQRTIAADVVLSEAVRHGDRAASDPAGWVLDTIEGLNLIG